MSHVRFVECGLPAGRACLFFLAWALSLSVAAIADVIVVDGAGGGSYTDIQPAVDAADSGDMVLVYPGIYGNVSISNKSVHICAAPGAVVDAGNFTITGLSRNLFLSGLSADHVTLTNCLGSVRLRDCTLNLLTLASAADVALSGSAVLFGMSATASRIALYRCRIDGLDGDYQECGVAADGGTGCYASQSALHFSDCYVEGGEGGSTQCCDSAGGRAGDGGDGLVLVSGSKAYTVATTFAAGLGGSTGHPFCGKDYGADGQDTRIDSSSSLVVLEAPRRTIATRGVARKGCGEEAWIEGAPGDQIYLPRSWQGRFLPAPQFFGVHHLARPVLLDESPLVVLPQSGHVSLRLPTIDDAFGVPPPSETIHYQLLVLDAAGQWALGEAAHGSAFDEFLASPCQDPIFVDVDAASGGDGTSWQSAFDDLHVALAEAKVRAASCARAFVEVWVAEGVYAPAPPGGSRTIKFVLPRNVALRGGFAGTESCYDESDPRAHPTILTGDLLGNDGPDFANTSDNSLNVLVSDSGYKPALVSGLVIRGGNSVPTNGGGAGAQLSYVRMIDCIVSDNQSGWAGGGVVASNSEILRSAFHRNRTEGAGGGAYISTCTVVECVFGGNQASVGGGLDFHNYHNVVAQCVFSGNRADTGAGCGAHYPTSNGIELSNCTFSRNIASTQGAAVGMIAYGHIEASNSIFWRNSVGSDVGETAQFALGLGDIEIDYCCVGGWTGALGGEGNFSANPQFVNAMGGDGLFGTEDDDLRLLPNSPCIDSASNSMALLDPGLFGDHLLRDLGGSPRFVDDPDVPDSGEGLPPIIDIGAHEHPIDG